MTAAERREPAPDLYQLLGVPPGASRQEIALAWRRRARDEHPDARPADASAPDRFRALAQAWHVLGDPVRRAAYDHALLRDRHSRNGSEASMPRVGDPVRVPPSTATAVPVRHLRGQEAQEADVPPTWTAEPPLDWQTPAVGWQALWAGPVLVERSGPGSFPLDRAEDEIRLAILSQLARRYLGPSW